MKIVSQSADRMSLQDGNIAGGIIGGIILVGGSAYGAYYLLTTSGQATVPVWIPAIVAIVGLAMMFMTSSIAVTIDKTQGTIIFARKRIVGTKIQSHATGDVTRVELREGSYRAPSSQPGFSMNGGRQVFESQTVIVFKDGTEMPLENKKDRGSDGNLIGTAVMMAGEGKDLSISQQVATFIGIPFEEMGGGSPRIDL